MVCLAEVCKKGKGKERKASMHFSHYSLRASLVLLQVSICSGEIDSVWKDGH